MHRTRLSPCAARQLVGKTSGLAEQGALAGTQIKKKGLPPMEERAGDSRGVQGSH